MPNIFLAIPAFNCDKQINRVLNELADCEELLSRVAIIAVFDNGSTDETIANLLVAKGNPSLREKLVIFRNRKNCGLGGTHKLAFRMASERSFGQVLILHGDNQASAKEALHLIKASETRPGAQVLGSRFRRLSLLAGYSSLRIAGNLLLNLWYSLLTRRMIWDLGSGLNLFDIRKWDLSEVFGFDDGFTFNMDLLLWLIASKASFVYVPISWRSEDEISNARAFRVGWMALVKSMRWLIRPDAFSKCKLLHETEKME